MPMTTTRQLKGPSVNTNQSERLSDYPEITEIPATYTNWFIATGSTEGIRIAFGESFDKDDRFIVGHSAVLMSLQTAIKLHNMLSAVIPGILNANQAQGARQETSDVPAPANQP